MVSAKSYSNGAQANEEPLLIGWDRDEWLSSRHFIGIIDKVRIYDRALSADEIDAIRNLNQ